MATSPKVKGEQAKGERELVSVLGEAEAEALFENRRKRDGDKAHITLAGPPDAKKAVANLADRDGISKGEAERRIKALAAEGVPDTFRVKGVGKAESGGKVAYFLVVDWPDGRAWRESVGLDPDGQDFHITLGFGPEGDVHGVPKNRLMRASNLSMKQAATGDAVFDVKQELRGGHDLIEDGNYFDYEYVNLASEAIKDAIRRLQGAGFLDFSMDDDGVLMATRPGGIEAAVEFDSWEENGRPWTEVAVEVVDPDRSGESKMASSSLRSKVIRLAHARPDLRPALLPLLKTAESFDDAVKGKTFTNPETGNKVQFGSLPSEEQDKIRSKWKEEEGGGEQEAKKTPATERHVENLMQDLHKNLKRDEYNEIDLASKEAFSLFKDFADKNRVDPKDLINMMYQTTTSEKRRKAIRKIESRIDDEPWDRRQAAWGMGPMPRSSYIPKDEPTLARAPGLPEGLEVYTYHRPNARGQVTYYGVAFAGKAQKPIWNYAFRDEAQRDRQIAETAKSVEARAKMMKERSDARKQFTHGLQVGDILYSSWGYDQTNVNWFEVVGAPTEKMILVREIASKTVRSDGYGSDEVIPVPGKYIGPAMKKIPTGGGGRSLSVKIDNVQTAWKWDGKPKRETSSGWGH